jgi:hypothetical protein
MTIKQITPEEAKNYRKINPTIDFIHGMNIATAFTREKEPNTQWEVITYYSDIRTSSVNNSDNYHYIYILTNPSIPGIVKIGFTERNAYERLKEINSASGVIIPWEIRFTYKCPYGRTLEGEIHSYLENIGLRLNKRREGFAMSVNDAINIVEELGYKYSNALGEGNDLV